MTDLCTCGKQLDDKNDVCCNKCLAEYIERHYLQYILENANDFTVEKLTITEFCKQDRLHFIEFLKDNGYIDMPFEPENGGGFLDEVDSRMDMFKDDNIYRAI